MLTIDRTLHSPTPKTTEVTFKTTTPHLTSKKTLNRSSNKRKSELSKYYPTALSSEQYKGHQQRISFESYVLTMDNWWNLSRVSSKSQRTTLFLCWTTTRMCSIYGDSLCSLFFMLHFPICFFFISQFSTNMILNNLIFQQNILESLQPNILESIAITLYCISTLYKLIYNNTMSKVTPFLQEVVFIVADFLDSLEHTKEASKLRKQYEIPEWVKKDNPLIKKGLKKVLKQFINDNEKILKYYKNRKPDSDEQVQSEEEVQTPKPTKKARQSASPRQSPLVKPKSPKVAHHQPAPSKGWMASQFQQPKRLEDLNDDHHEVPKQAQVDVPKKDKKNHKKEVKKQSSSEEHSESQQTPKPKKQKKQIKKQKKVKRVKGPVDSSYLNSEEEFELEDKKAKRSVTPQKQSAEKAHKKVEPVKHQIVTRKKSTQIKEVPEKTSTQIAVKQVNKTWQNNDQNEYNGPKKFFSRIDHNEVGFIPQNRRDNTFEAKARYGAGDSWGQFGHEKLKDTRGDSFKKTKGKLKNKAFQGSGINIDQVNSVPIL